MIVSCCCRGVQSPNVVIRKIGSHTPTQKPGNNDLSTTTVKINWESAIRKEFPLPVSLVQHSRGRVCCKHKRSFFVSWLRVLSLSVFLSNCQYRNKSMILTETTSSERGTIITFEGPRLFSQFLHIFHGFSTNITQTFMDVIM